MPFARFMAVPVGRGIHVEIGLALILWGSALGTTACMLFAIVCAFNFCGIAPVLGAPFSG